MKSFCPDSQAKCSPGDGWVLYGLAGNPPHAGHWSCVRQLLDLRRRVIVAPSYAHAFGKAMAPFETRLRWLEAARVDFGLDSGRVIVWSAEARVAAGRPEGASVYSIEMLRLAEYEFGGSVALAVGPDNADLAVFSRFREHEAIARDHGLVVLSETPGIRSTMIRQRLLDGLLGVEELSALVGPAIAPSVMRYFAKPAAALKGL